ncbi:MAG TPA: glycoside hydrolase family 2 TIM barrel-domain containing protein [Pirellulales bacterium]|nr:glycoside hydrolase family 2 TIM barrel-domain containing protein [Pirellulales bacterium]
MTSLIRIVGLLFACSSVAAAEEAWKPAPAPLATRWAKDVSPERTLPEYPRPQLVREAWLNLNGLWEYAIAPKDAEQPSQFAGQILVPFPIESSLSGVMKRVQPAERIWYRRTFALDKAWAGKRVLLHFGAADWRATVWVNGRRQGEHSGGYDPFSFDITEAIKPGAEQEIVVSVWDPSDAGPQPRGKQVSKPGGIYYTPSSGIWQTVWLEAVPEAYIPSLKITPDADRRRVRFNVDAIGMSPSDRLAVKVTSVSLGDEARHLKGPAQAAAIGEALELELPEAKLWSPDEPWLYHAAVSLVSADGRTLDEVQTYFGLRKVAVGPDDRGVTRILFNDKPLFMFGPLDQGFWPDGLYTAPTDEALRFDVETTKRLGFNMCRKHVKVEPARWYYWCDKLGLLVWQDMPSGEKSVGPGKGEIQRMAESAAIYEQELKAMIDARRNSPSIVAWVVFNEGWGQFDTVRITQWTKKYDPSRLVDCASGWNDFPAGDMHDIHNYPAPKSPQPESKRAAVLGEYGGLGLPLEGHTWLAKNNWGYRSYPNREALSDAYFDLLVGLRPLIASPGLSAAVYTQTTDVETEVNGLLTYDRDVLKIDADRLAKAHAKLYLPPPVYETLLPTSQQAAHEWRFVFEQPAGDWFAADYDAAAWSTGPGGFGTQGTPGAAVRTEWNGPEIWLRREFELSADQLDKDRQLVLSIHHDEDAEIYLNGVLAAAVKGFTTDYVQTAVSQEAQSALHAGRNLIAVHCKQTGGGQYIDVGIVRVKER